MQPLTSCETAGLFRPLLAELVALLRALQGEDWDRETVARGWRVKDVAAHLLDGDLRKIAVYRDHHVLPAGAPIRSEQDLSRFINALNASGIEFAKRLSPRLIVDLLEMTGAWVAAIVEALPPHAPARFAVSWAGESTSENWMDTGREYTERWHHQAQIRDAVGALRLLEPKWLEPLIDISIRVLPRAYSAIRPPDGTAITLAVEGRTIGAWTILRTGGAWSLFRGQPASPSALVRVAADDVWRLFYNALPAQAIASRVIVEGDSALAAPLLRARSVIL